MRTFLDAGANVSCGVSPPVAGAGGATGNPTTGIADVIVARRRLLGGGLAGNDDK